MSKQSKSKGHSTAKLVADIWSLPHPALWASDRGHTWDRTLHGFSGQEIGDALRSLMETTPTNAPSLPMIVQVIMKQRGSRAIAKLEARSEVKGCRSCDGTGMRYLEAIAPRGRQYTWRAACDCDSGVRFADAGHTPWRAAVASLEAKGHVIVASGDEPDQLPQRGQISDKARAYLEKAMGSAEEPKLSDQIRNTDGRRRE
tara:strand:+ start:5983 stop:6585 length:603 start_codon:yes stop_codon:yes gene_type:complete